MDRRKLLKALSVTGIGALTSQLQASRASAQGLGSLHMLTATAPPDLVCHVFYYAEKLGFYKDLGLNFRVEPVANDPTALRGVLAGVCDIAWCGALTTLQALRTGADLKVLSCFTPSLDYKIIARNDIASVKAMEGKPVAVSQMGAVSQIVPKIMIENAGGDPSKVQWVSAGGGPNRYQALVAGRVSAAPLNALHAGLAAEMTDKFHVIATAVKDLPYFIYAWDIITSATLAKKPNELRAFIRGTARASQWATENPQRAAELSQQILPDVNLKDLERAIVDFAASGYWSKTGAVSPQAWKYTTDTLIRNGDIPSAPPAENILVKL